MADLATAYLRLIPSLKGAQGSIERELGGINTSATGDRLGMGLGEGIKGGIGKLALGTALGGMLMEGVEMAASAAADTFKAAFENVGTFEQLKGGVEKIFDEADTAQIFADAQGAYKDLNMSANEYLETINQVGATFAQTMGDQAGYDTARQGMMAIADYASGTGRSIDELNEKYKLITRSSASYQSIADQFSGILPQTSDDFLAQAQAAGLLSDEYGKLTEVPVAEYQAAVTAMIEKGVDDMGLLGNTAAESAGTLTGSIAMMQSSWQNLLTEFGKDDGDIEARMNELVESIGAVLENAMPVVERILSGMGEAIGNFASRAGDYFREHKEEIFDKVGEFIMMALEAIVTSIPAIVAGMVELVASLIGYVITHIPEMAGAAQELLVGFVVAVAEATLPACQAIGDVIMGMANSVGDFVTDLFNAGADLVQGLIDGILSMPGRVADAIGDVVGGAIDEGKRMLGIASPSKVFREIGEYAMQGYIEGVDFMRPDVARATGRAMAAATSVGGSQLAAGAAVGATGNVYYVTIDGTLVSIKQRVVNALDEIASCIEQEAVM